MATPTNGGNEVITDMVSFYTLPSTVIGNTRYNTLKAAYSFYNVATSVKHVDLVKDALILAKKVRTPPLLCVGMHA